MKNKMERLFGLVGYPLSHSFSKQYFTQKFEKEGILYHKYELYPLASIDGFPELIEKSPSLSGLNVTIPYKQNIFPFLHEIDPEAAAIGAVNVIKIKDGKMIGYNSDVYGFEHSLLDFLNQNIEQAKNIQSLILGTGGASKAVAYVLKKLGIPSFFVSRNKKEGILTYDELSNEIMEKNQLIVNCTPVGSFPNIEQCPNIPYQITGSKHFFYDLVYNPEETMFLKKGKEHGALTCNGLAMLHLQADRAWEIWNS